MYLSNQSPDKPTTGTLRSQNPQICDKNTTHLSSIIAPLEDLSKQANHLKLNKGNLDQISYLKQQLANFFAIPDTSTVQQLLNDVPNNPTLSITYPYSNMNTIQKAAKWHAQLLNINLDFIKSQLNSNSDSQNYYSQGIELDLTMSPYKWVGLDSDIHKSLYVCPNIESKELNSDADTILKRFTINNQQKLTYDVRGFLDGKLQQSKNNPNTPLIAAIEVSDSKFTEPYVFKILNGKITDMLRSNSQH